MTNICTKQTCYVQFYKTVYKAMRYFQEKLTRKIRLTSILLKIIDLQILTLIKMVVHEDI